MTVREWLLYRTTDIMLAGNCHWMGVEALKNPLDAWIYQEIIHEVRPDSSSRSAAIAEIVRFFANLLSLLASGVVVSIDLDRSRFHTTTSK